MDLSNDHTSGSETPISRQFELSERMSTVAREGMLRDQVRRGFVPEAQWRSALRGICDEARAGRVPPEQLLREMKDALRILCDACAVPHGTRRTEFTERVVTLCIEEYFRRDPQDD